MQETLVSTKVALITGGAKRIGATVARHLHAVGMNLVIHYHRSEREARALQEELHTQRPDSVLLVQTDLLSVAKLTRMMQQVISHYQRLDVLVNNASSFYPTPVGHITEEQWEDLIGTNLKIPLFLSQLAAPHLTETEGCIINLADIHAERPLKQHTVYSVAKAGLVMLTQSLARELGPAVRVNAIAPGVILWPESNQMDELAKQRIISHVPLRRSGSPDDIAKTIVFLVTQAPYITGQVISVDGGRTLVQ